MDVERLKRETPSYVFQQWLAYRKMQRWGEDWYQAAMLTAATIKSDKPISAFMPKYTPPAAGNDAVNQTNAILDAFLANYEARRAARGNR